ncbi:MAG: S24 family peptidase [Flavobacteriales bacterium]
MKIIESGKIRKVKERHQAEVSQQTGFPSAATHYLEPSIDLNKELIITPDATFFVRIEGDEWNIFNIFENDVLLIDRSLHPKLHHLVLIVVDGAFKIIKMQEQSSRSFILWGVVSYIIHDVT